MAATGVFRNERYYAGKTAVGLQEMLTGTGMRLGGEVLERRQWTGLSAGEGWESPVEHHLGGETIYFNPLVRTFAKEPQKLNQASHRRWRWASGRYAVMGGKVWAPLSIAGSRVNAGNPFRGGSCNWAAALLAAIPSYFAPGVFSAEAAGKALAGQVFVPGFFLGVPPIESPGIRGSGRRLRGRGSRATTSSQNADR